MSQNLCPKCHKPIRLPQDEVMVIRKNLGHGRTLDHMVHKVCPTAEVLELPGIGKITPQTYCSNCGHAEQLHSPKCAFANYGYNCDCSRYRK